MDDIEKSAARAELTRLVSEVSEDSYYTWWMPGVDFTAWAALTDPDASGGKGLVFPSEWQRDELVRLATAIGEWPVRDLPAGLDAAASEMIELETYSETMNFVTIEDMSSFTGTRLDPSTAALRL